MSMRCNPQRKKYTLTEQIPLRTIHDDFRLVSHSLLLHSVYVYLICHAFFIGLCIVCFIFGVILIDTKGNNICCMTLLLLAFAQLFQQHLDTFFTVSSSFKLHNGHTMSCSYGSTTIADTSGHMFAVPSTQIHLDTLIMALSF